MTPDIASEVDKVTWRNFLLAQPEVCEGHFSYPSSFAARAYFSEMLEMFATRAIKIGSVAGLHGFLSEVKDEATRGQMIGWIEKYTPIRQVRSANDILQWHVMRAFVEKCDLIEGKANPFYTLKPRPHVLLQAGSKALRIASGHETSKEYEFSLQSAAISDLSFAIKVAKIAFNEFLSQRSNSSRQNLINRIMEIPLGDSPKKGSPIVQGGLPGLGRR
jgi:hypothetical protein